MKKRPESRPGRCLKFLPLLAAAVMFAFPATSLAPPTAPASPVPAGRSDLSLLQCGNLIYATDKSSVCFADNFLSDVARQTNLRVNQKFCPVRLESDTLFDYPFCVMSGNDDFALTQKERAQLRKYLTSGGFLLISPGCSDEKWDESLRKEIKVCFPEYSLKPIPANHAIFSSSTQSRGWWTSMARRWVWKDWKSTADSCSCIRRKV